MIFGPPKTGIRMVFKASGPKSTMAVSLDPLGKFGRVLLLVLQTPQVVV